MTPLEKQAYEWALNQKYESVSARYARILAQYIEREATRLTAHTAERDSLREAHQELSRLAREVSRMYSDTSWNIGAIRKLTQYIDNKDKENQNER